VTKITKITCDQEYLDAITPPNKLDVSTSNGSAINND